MSRPNGAGKRLPAKPSQENLRKQAKRRAAVDAVPLAEAQHRLAGEYGCGHWGELMQLVEAMGLGAGAMSSGGAGNGVMQAAARKKDIDAVRRLLAAGQFGQEDLDGGLAGALWYGGQGEWPRMKAAADLLLEYGADPDGFYTTYGPIVFGTGECLQPESLQYLINAGADVTFPPIDTKYGKQCPLSCWLGTYARGGNERKHRGIEILLEHKAVIPEGVTPAVLAIHRGDTEGLAELVEREPSLARKTFADLPYGNILLGGASLLHCAAEFDEVECCGVLLDRGADVNLRADVIEGIGGQTAVFHLVNTGWESHLGTLEYLVKRAGKSMDLSVRATWRTADGEHLMGVPQAVAATAMEYAQAAGDERRRKNKEAEIAVLRLVERGGAGEDGAAGTGTEDQLPAICVAASLGRVEEVRRLIAGGADVNEADSKGNTALWHVCESAAATEDRLAVARLLIEAGARVREDGEGGSTALHRAARRGPVEMVELLLRHGAKEWQPDGRGRKALDDARAGDGADRREIVEILDRPVIRDPIFRAAVAAVQTGDLQLLRVLLAERPSLVRESAVEPDFYPRDYFRDPKLLWFVANNPNLIERMPANAVEVAAAIIDAGAERADLDYTLELVMTCRPAREQGLQRPLMKVLLERGARVTPRAIRSTLGHGERDAVAALLEGGLAVTAEIAAGMGMVRELPGLLAAADTKPRDEMLALAMIHRLPETAWRLAADDAEPRQAALALAVINRELEAARLCLAAGADPNWFMVVHAHSLPVHQAAVHDDVPMLRLLVEHGAKLDIRDTLWQGTPLGWARHEGKAAAEAYLRSVGGR